MTARSPRSRSSSAGSNSPRSSGKSGSASKAAKTAKATTKKTAKKPSPKPATASAAKKVAKKASKASAKARGKAAKPTGRAAKPAATRRPKAGPVADEGAPQPAVSDSLNPAPLETKFPPRRAPEPAPFEDAVPPVHVEPKPGVTPPGRDEQQRPQHPSTMGHGQPRPHHQGGPQGRPQSGQDRPRHEDRRDNQRGQRDGRDRRDGRDGRPQHDNRGPRDERGPRDQREQRDNRDQRDRRSQEQRPAAPPPQAAPGDVSPTAAAAAKHFEEIFERQTPFSSLGLSEPVLKGITDAGFEFPTSIQAKLIPLILSGKDMLGQAKTGTGKTAAFGLPLLSRVQRGTPFQALVLVPTRELAIQVATDLRELGRFTNLNILPVYGGQNVKTQAQMLQRGPEIIVATPGRVMDMVQRNYITYRNIKMVILDEVDRMLDIGFRDDIRRILGACPRDRQTVFVSATISPEIESLARSFATNCEKIVASAGSLTVSMVRQFHLPVAPWDKKQLLLHLLTHEEPALTVVFCRTKRTVDNLTEYLQRKGVDCHAIHGDMYQNKRNKVMEQLRSGKLEVLVASDVASRGLDVEGITHVINYDLPEDPDLYVHRIGRTARAGRDGVAWSLVTPEQGALLTQIELLINAEIPKLDYPDFKPGPIPADVLASQKLSADKQQLAKQYNRFASPGSSASPASTPSPQVRGEGHVASFSPADADPTRFPGGIVPTKAPPKRMFGRVKTARSMKQAIQQTFMPQNQVPGAPPPTQPRNP